MLAFHNWLRFSSFSSSANQTETLADKVSISGGNGVLSFATAGLAANSPAAEAQNVTVAYDAKAVSVSGMDMGMRSSFFADCLAHSITTYSQTNQVPTSPCCEIWE